ncbi:uncharacterized protein LOC120129680 [Hibiscus syriacus]|uniref:uncharacterized protein LOC120129680 n=1 Tax=Hibiscus syriacus TaxID=106335 RepID=UPI001923FABF|nr:uncharacterized protein LOC120129680 [Hibiscus syriacus]
MSPKLKDHGSFSIPCYIEDFYMGRALCDSVASINLMPLSIVKWLGLNGMKLTMVTLQLAKKSLTYIKGKIKDVVVRMNKFSFPFNYNILDCEVDKDVPIILGQLLLTTSKTMIDVSRGEVTMRLNGDYITFSVIGYNSFKGAEERNTIVLFEDNHRDDFKDKDDRKTWVHKSVQNEVFAEPTMV